MLPTGTVRIILVAALGHALLACAGAPGGVPLAKDFKAKGPHEYTSKRNLISNYMARNQDDSINVVVEIPAGTNDKWEVSESGDSLVRDFTGDKPRVVDYLPYPGNYGMIPRTLLSTEKGGDGSPLDVMVLGPAVARGSVIRARPIGVVRVIDRMEQDDKVLAVMEDSTLSGVYDAESLEKRYPGAGQIVSIWFANAHGRRSKVQLMGTGSLGQANSVIDYAIESYKAARMKARSE